MSDYWPWIDELARTSPAKLANGQGECTVVGPYNWTVQTFIYLRDAGFTCELTDSLPEDGIIITHGDFLPADLKPSAGQFVVEIKPDRELQCVFANFVIVQNRHDPICHGLQRLFISSAFINVWPQPGLIPRDVSRGDRFEHVCFMGNPEEFLQEVDLLKGEISKLGLTWTMTPRDRWHDYSQADAIVAIRPLDYSAAQKKGTAAFSSLSRKPASKLYNAWLAGVPAVLSPDIAFRDLRRSDLDYLEARNILEIIGQLKRLMDDASLRRSMVENGRTRASEFTVQRNVRTWQAIIHDQIIPQYAAWSRSPLRRRWFHLSRTAIRTRLSRDET